MTRTEIIANRALEEDIIERLREHGVPPLYTKVPAVHGAGSSGERHGDHVWPEENVLFLFYTDGAVARTIVDVVRSIKRQYPDTGVKLYQYQVDAIVL